MAVTATTTSTLDNLLSTYYVRTAVPRLVARAVLWSNAPIKQNVPLQEGKAVVFNAWSNFAPISATITEATTPDAASLSSRKITATVSQFGRNVRISDLAQKTISLDAIQGAIDNLTDSAGLSLDKIVQLAIFKSSLGKNTNATILSAWMSNRVSAFASGSQANSNSTWGFPVVFGTTATRLSAVNVNAPSVSARMSLYAIKKAVKQIRALNALEFADGYMRLVTNSDAVADLRTDPDFKNWMQYTDSAPMKQGDATVPVEGCRILVSNNLPKHRATAHSVDCSFIFGQGAYGVTGIGEGNGFEIIVKRSGDGDTSNPLNLYGTVGYKGLACAAATNTSAGRILFTHGKP